MGFHPSRFHAIRYRGFLLLQDSNYGWLVRPERSPMAVLPFRTGQSSLAEIKALVDQRLGDQSQVIPTNHPIAS